jgi:hypothetical protein
MNITQAQYYADAVSSQNMSIQATIDGVEWSVPLDPANRHYQAILEWVEDGNTIEDAD